MFAQVVVLTPVNYGIYWGVALCVFLAALFVVIRSAILSANRAIKRAERTTMSAPMN